MFGDLPLSILWQDRMHCLVRRKHLIEIANIENILRELGLELSRNLFIQKSIRIKIFEPRMLYYLIDSTILSNTLAGILLQALVDEILAVV